MRLQTPDDYPDILAFALPRSPATATGLPQP